MTSPACCRHGETPGLPGALPSRETSRAARDGATIDHFDLLRRATQMMATGALTEDQARTLSRQILTSVAAGPGH